MKGLKLKNERGAVTIVEATFVFPIMFFVLFFLLFYGNSYYVKSNIDSIVSRYTIAAAAEIADPLLPSVVENGKIESINQFQPYRYLDKKYGDDIIKKYKRKISEEAKFSGYFSTMMPVDVSCKGEYKNYVLYQTVRYNVEYKIQIPIRIIFFEKPTILEYISEDEAPVGDSAEFVLNSNMVFDYLDRTGLPEKINELKDKIKNLK